MSPVQRLRLVGFDASLKQRGVVLSLTPGDAPAIGLVEVVDSVSRQRLKIQDELISHVLHIKRDDLKTLAGAADFDTWLADVQHIDRTDESDGYRVQYFSDDPQRPAVMFFCVTI